MTFDAAGAGTEKDSTNGTYPQSINRSGAVTGYLQSSDNAFHGFVRHRDGSIQVFDVLEAGTTAFLGAFPANINDSGAIPGSRMAVSPRSTLRKPTTVPVSAPPRSP